jgi:hypothetical protein
MLELQVFNFAVLPLKSVCPAFHAIEIPPLIMGEYLLLFQSCSMHLIEGYDIPYK